MNLLHCLHTADLNEADYSDLSEDDINDNANDEANDEANEKDKDNEDKDVSRQTDGAHSNKSSIVDRNSSSEHVSSRRDSVEDLSDSTIGEVEAELLNHERVPSCHDDDGHSANLTSSGSGSFDSESDSGESAAVAGSVTSATTSVSTSSATSSCSVSSSYGDSMSRVTDSAAAAEIPSKSPTDRTPGGDNEKDELETCEKNDEDTTSKESKETKESLAESRELNRSDENEIEEHVASPTSDLNDSRYENASDAMDYNDASPEIDNYADFATSPATSPANVAPSPRAVAPMDADLGAEPNEDEEGEAEEDEERIPRRRTEYGADSDKSPKEQRTKRNSAGREDRAENEVIEEKDKRIKSDNEDENNKDTIKDRNEFKEEEEVEALPSISSQNRNLEDKTQESKRDILNDIENIES